MTFRRRRIDGFIVPSATSTRVFRCPDPECKHIHLVGYDDDHVPMCEIVIDDNILDKIQKVHSS